jgi:geranylgeranyl pyrophosphate synthase
LGKTAGKDKAQEKSTYPALLGLEGARRRATELFDEAREAAAAFGESAGALSWLADFIQKREH